MLWGSCRALQRPTAPREGGSQFRIYAHPTPHVMILASAAKKGRPNNYATEAKGRNFKDKRYTTGMAGDLCGDVDVHFILAICEVDTRRNMTGNAGLNIPSVGKEGTKSRLTYVSD